MRRDQFGYDWKGKDVVSAIFVQFLNCRNDFGLIQKNTDIHVWKLQLMQIKPRYFSRKDGAELGFSI